MTSLSNSNSNPRADCGYKRKPQADRQYEHKWRNCLKCCGAFVSEWPGERICKKCKQTGEWRGGIGLLNVKW